jgi:hypothetical protein
MASLCKQQDLRLYLGSHSLAYKRSNAPPGGQQATVDSWCFEVPIALVPTQPVRRNCNQRRTPASSRKHRILPFAGKLALN